MSLQVEVQIIDYWFVCRGTVEKTTFCCKKWGVVLSNATMPVNWWQSLSHGVWKLTTVRKCWKKEEYFVTLNIDFLFCYQNCNLQFESPVLLQCVMVVSGVCRLYFTIINSNSVEIILWGIWQSVCIWTCRYTHIWVMYIFPSVMMLGVVVVKYSSVFW